jgi:hypothetical protein
MNNMLSREQCKSRSIHRIHLRGPTFIQDSLATPPKVAAKHHISQRRTPVHPTIHNALPQDKYRMVRAVIATAES